MEGWNSSKNALSGSWKPRYSDSGDRRSLASPSWSMSSISGPAGESSLLVLVARAGNDPGGGGARDEKPDGLAYVDGED
ncbi:hypothetical protein CVT26_002856 [Gymnopilus dilepis]|uniref:Uncharacterized protein n=1 Tax=Gymnopilus dilepis TaxID=231916 RepID=A0A409Y356_9AGAR|nr:hypothetical protein CVT26_002856 [Gymnopilus dilepis]